MPPIGIARSDARRTTVFRHPLANPLRRSAPDAGHYGWEEKAEEYRSRILGWVSGGYKPIAAG